MPTLTVKFSDFDDEEVEDLIEEMVENGYIVIEENEIGHTPNQLVDMFKNGDDEVVEKCKRFLEDVTGRTI